MDLGPVKDYFAAIGALATFWWALRQRRAFPRAQVRHRVSDIPIDDHNVLLRIEVTIQNKGEILLSLAEGFIALSQVRPWPEHMLAAIQSGDDPVRAGETEIDWPRICDRWAGQDCKVEIEPGEEDEIHFEFVLGSSVQAVKVYTHLQNEKRTFYQRTRRRVAAYIARFCRRAFLPPLRRLRRTQSRQDAFALVSRRRGSRMAKRLRQVMCRIEKCFHRRATDTVGVGWNNTTYYSLQSASPTTIDSRGIEESTSGGHDEPGQV